MKKNKATTVIIPNWNGRDLLKDCLSSLMRQKFGGFEVIVVDNGSTDGSVEYISKKFPAVKIKRLAKNFGFAKAINVGVKNCQSKYVVFLNNDTEVDRNWLKELVECIKQNPKTVSVNSKILNFYSRKKIDGVGILINEVGQAKSIGWDEVDKGQYENQMKIFGATGGASIFRRDFFIRAGMFDESYFMYSEEVDFAFRAQFLGYKSIYCPKALVYHKHKATSRKLPQHIEYWQYRNMIQTIIKDMPTKILFRKGRWLKIVLVYVNTFFYQIKNGYIWPAFLVQIWLLINLPRLLFLRFKIAQTKIVSDEYIEKFLVSKQITFWGLTKKGRLNATY